MTEDMTTARQLLDAYTMEDEPLADQHSVLRVLSTPEATDA